MSRSLLNMYRLKFATTIVYMLQATEYQILPYLKWLWRVEDFGKVAYRKALVRTNRAKMVLLVTRLGMLAQYAAALTWLLVTLKNEDPNFLLAFLLLISTPIVWAHLLLLPILVARWLIVNPLSWLEIQRSARTFKDHPGLKIAIAGTYGKTTMKEILSTVLSQGKKVAATPANKNVAISHARFARQLSGDEAVLIIELGEGAPGDVARFTETVRPDVGIITGLAPAHLDKYKTLEQAGKDIFSLADYLGQLHTYVNADSPPLAPFIKKSHQLYGMSGALGWQVGSVKAGINGLSFNLSKNGKTIRLKSRLLGKHQVGPLALAAALAKKVGLSDEQVKSGIAKIEPFEHRMQPREVGGAWIIDDTYNGNIEGMMAGLDFLKSLKEKRKIYVTPGLVDQGADSPKIHRRLGEGIAEAKPDIVILMRNSATKQIIEGIENGDYHGKLVIEEDPLAFYTNLDQFVAAGDIILLQNDWPDNYY